MPNGEYQAGIFVVDERAATNDASPAARRRRDAAVVEVGRVEPVAAAASQARGRSTPFAPWSTATTASVDQPVRHGRRPGADHAVLAGVDEPRRAGGTAAAHDEAVAAVVHDARRAARRPRPSAPACARPPRRACSRPRASFAIHQGPVGLAASPHALTSCASCASAVTSRVIRREPLPTYASAPLRCRSAGRGERRRRRSPAAGDRSPRAEPARARPISTVRPSSAERSTASAVSSTCSPSSPEARCGRSSRIAASISSSPRPRVSVGPRGSYGTGFHSPSAVPDAHRAAECIRVGQLERAAPMPCTTSPLIVLAERLEADGERRERAALELQRRSRHASARRR